MNLVREFFGEVKVLEPFRHTDLRGTFVKPFHYDELVQHKINFLLKEEFFSSSMVGVIRGFHFQMPPDDHAKFVYCICGKVLDVILDLRKGSSSYGECTSVELSSHNRYIVYIPRGFAHAFACLEENSYLIYKTDTVYAPLSDRGILWSSLNFDWPFEKPIISERDQGFPTFSNFYSPFNL